MTGIEQREDQEREGATVSVEVADRDRLAVVVSRIRATRQDGRPAAPAAGQVAEAVDYLGERLRLVERGPAEALVRSAVPVTATDGKQYYEGRFDGDSLVLERRHAMADGTVESIPFVVPHPILARLVADLGRLVGAPQP